MPGSGAGPGGPVVVLLDDGHRESFRELAGALRRTGLGVRHVLLAGGPPQHVSGRALSRLVLGPAEEIAVHLGDDGPGAASVRRRLLAPPVVDVQGAEDVMAGLVSTPEWAEAVHLHHQRDGLDPAAVYDKLTVHGLAVEAGVGVPQVWAEPPVGGPFPLAVKGRHGYGGRRVRVALDDEGLAAAWARVDGPDGVFAEQWLDGDLVSSGGVADHGRLVVAASYESIHAPGRPLEPSVRIRVRHEPAVLDSMAALTAALGWTGMIDMNWVLGADGVPRLIDLNPRLWGSWQALAHSGLDIAGAYAGLFLPRRGARPDRLIDGAEVPVLRLNEVDGGTVRDLSRSAGAAAREIWGRRGLSGTAWAVSSTLRVAGRVARRAPAVSRARPQD